MTEENINSSQSNTEGKSSDNKITKQQKSTSDDVLNCMNANVLTHKMVNFVLQQKFDSFVSLVKVIKCWEKFYEQENLAAAKQSDIDQLKEFNVFNPKNYKTKISVDDMANISNFRDELMTHIRIEAEKKAGTRNPEKYKLTRQVNPPLEAYKYIAPHKIDIKDTGRNYGTLFE